MRPWSKWVSDFWGRVLASVIIIIIAVAGRSHFPVPEWVVLVLALAIIFLIFVGLEP